MLADTAAAIGRYEQSVAADLGMLLSDTARSLFVTVNRPRGMWALGPFGRSLEMFAPSEGSGDVSRSGMSDAKENRMMKYRIHRLDVTQRTAQEKLEEFVNRLEGRVVSVVPYVVPIFRPMGATSKVAFLLIVEEVR